jgi:serine/threonine-protein kinase RIO1
MILFKLLNRGFISEINGCISTGKEANVYHCTTKEGRDRAIKIYKTSILVFKDRDKYVTGEFRFRQGYGRKNPRKMVRTWAEKEMRNLTRLHNVGIPCPGTKIFNVSLYFYFSGRENKKVFKLNVVVNLICKNGVSVVALFFGLESFKFKIIIHFFCKHKLLIIIKFQNRFC